jgi:outer membrane protein assembly factor BamB
MNRVLSLAALLAASAPLGCTNLPEPMDPWEPGATSQVGLPVLGLVWKRVIHDRSFDSKPQEFASPAVYADPLRGTTIFAGSHGRNFWALRADTGSEVWKQSVGSVSARPVVDRGRIIVGTDDGAMLALDTWDGSEKWRYETKGAVQQSPALANGLVIFSTDADVVVAVEKATGKWRWQYDRETPEEFTLRGHAGVVVANDKVYTGFADGFVVALTVDKGEVVWVRSLAGDKTQFVDVDATPAVANGILYVASAAGGLYALDAEDGTERWRQPLQGVGGIALDGDRIYVAAADEGLHSLDLNGHVLWRQGMFRAGDPGAPQIRGDYLLVNTAERGLYIVDKRNGELFESFDPGQGISAEPTIDGDRLYILSNGGILYAMGIRDF